VKQEVMAGQFHVPSHPGVLKKVYINGNILVILKKSRGTNICVLEKNISFII